MEAESDMHIIPLILVFDYYSGVEKLACHFFLYKVLYWYCMQAILYRQCWLTFTQVTSVGKQHK